ncbi:MAG TPA: hypothetical protein VF641_03155 [Methylobacterium sp.]
MKNSSRPALLRSFAIVLALVGAMVFASPQSAQAAPATFSSEVAGSETGPTEIRYHGRRHFRHHHHRRHFGHHRGRHLGHHRHHRHHHHGRRHRF